MINIRHDAVILHHTVNTETTRQLRLCSVTEKTNLSLVPNHSLTVSLPPPLPQLRRDHHLLKGQGPPIRGASPGAVAAGSSGLKPEM